MIAWLRERAKQRLHAHTRGFAKDTFKLSLGSVAVIGGYTLQISLITHFLGLSAYGTFATVVATVDLIARLLDFQVGQMVTAFGAESLRTDPQRVAGIAQFGYLVDGGAGILGFGIVVAIAPLLAPHLLGEDYGAWLFVIYALTMLVTTTESTSIALLQLSGKFSTILRLILARESLRLTFVLAAVLMTDTLAAVLLAVAAMEAIMAVLWTLSASRTMHSRLGQQSLWRPALSRTAGVRAEMARMIFHTNVISYVKVLAGQGPTLLLGVMRTPVEVGAFKIGMSIGAIVGKLADPAWAAVLPRFAKLRAAGRVDEIRGLIRQTSIGVVGITTTLGAIAILFRDPLLRLFGGPEAIVAGTVLILAVVGRVTNSAFFWNTPLLFALKHARSAAVVYVTMSVIFVPVLVVCIDRWGANGAALAVLFWTVLVNGLLAVVAIRALRTVVPVPAIGTASPITGMSSASSANTQL